MLTHQKKTGIVLSISEKADFRTRKTIKDEELSLLQEHITNLHIYVLNRASKYMRQTLTELQEEIDMSTIIVRDFSIVY